MIYLWSQCKSHAVHVSRPISAREICEMKKLTIECVLCAVLFSRVQRSSLSSDAARSLFSIYSGQCTILAHPNATANLRIISFNVLCFYIVACQAGWRLVKPEEDGLHGLPMAVIQKRLDQQQKDRSA